MDCPTHEKNENKCPMNKNDFRGTISSGNLHCMQCLITGYNFRCWFRCLPWAVPRSCVYYWRRTGNAWTSTHPSTSVSVSPRRWVVLVALRGLGAKLWTIPQMSIIFIYNSTWSILIQKIRIILSGDDLT